MANYKYEKIHQEFIEYFRKSRDKSTKAAWQFCMDSGIEHKASDLLPSTNTVYKWREKEILKKQLSSTHVHE